MEEIRRIGWIIVAVIFQITWLWVLTDRQDKRQHKELIQCIRENTAAVQRQLDALTSATLSQGLPPQGYNTTAMEPELIPSGRKGRR